MDTEFEKKNIAERPGAVDIASLDSLEKKKRLTAERAIQQAEFARQKEGVVISPEAQKAINLHRQESAKESNAVELSPVARLKLRVKNEEVTKPAGLESLLGGHVDGKSINYGNTREARTATEIVGLPQKPSLN